MASNEMDISTLSLDQLNQLKSQHEQELNQLRERHSSLKQAEGRFRQSKDALEAISKDDEGKSMLVPLTQSLYVPGKLCDVDSLLVELGTGYYLEKKKDDADAMIDRKIKLVADNAENITTVVAQKTRNHEAIVMMMQHKMAQIQEKKAEFDRQQDRGA
jgi:prefoldin alpha subunit